MLRRCSGKAQRNSAPPDGPALLREEAGHRHDRIFEPHGVQGVLAFSVRPARAMVSSMSRGVRSDPAYMARHSRTVRPGSVSCKTTPTRSRQAPPAVAGSCPRTETWPAVRCRKPSRICTVVVLPAPFGPRKAKISPPHLEIGARHRHVAAVALNQAAHAHHQLGPGQAGDCLICAVFLAGAVHLTPQAGISRREPETSPWLAAMPWADGGQPGPGGPALQGTV